MKKNFKCISFLVLLAIPQICLPETFSSDSRYTVCFTPGQDCTREIIEVLSHVQHSVYVQAYSFTSQPIASALVAAKNRGVEVKVILDKSQYKAEKYSSSKFLDNQGISVWIDSKPAIAHNKIMIVDSEIVITGSFNFTKAAQQKNAENLLIIHDPFLAKQYFNHWKLRQAQSYKLNEYRPHSRTPESIFSERYSFLQKPFVD